VSTAADEFKKGGVKMKKMTYEQALKRLEEIVSALEQGSKPLEETMKIYEEATALAAFCGECLDKAEQKITTLSALKPGADDDGEL